MSDKIYLRLLILCDILFQGIFATSDEDTGESSELLVRKRRVINHTPGGDNMVPIESANYMVIIKEHNRAKCIGIILSHYTVLTVAPCVRYDKTAYKVFSGSPVDNSSSKIHNITSKEVNYGDPPHERYDVIALLTVHPPFVFGRKTGNIELHVGVLPVGTMATVLGWSATYPIQPSPLGPRRKLRSINVPIISLTECHNIYRGAFDITDKHICTYNAQQYCAIGDIGAPLVYMERLAGIHIWKGERRGQRNPDVFLDLKRPDYSEWIRERTRLV